MQYPETLYKRFLKQFSILIIMVLLLWQGKTEVRAKINPTESKTFFYRATLKEKEM